MKYKDYKEYCDYEKKMRRFFYGLMALLFVLSILLMININDILTMLF